MVRMHSCVVLVLCRHGEHSFCLCGREGHDTTAESQGVQSRVMNAALSWEIRRRPTVTTTDWQTVLVLSVGLQLGRTIAVSKWLWCGRLFAWPLWVIGSSICHVLASWWSLFTTRRPAKWFLYILVFSGGVNHFNRLHFTFGNVAVEVIMVCDVWCNCNFSHDNYLPDVAEYVFCWLEATCSVDVVVLWSEECWLLSQMPQHTLF